MIIESLILVGAIHSFYLAFLEKTKKEGSYADTILAIFIFLVGIMYLVYFLANSFNEREWMIYLWNSSLLLSPFVFIYTLELTGYGWNRKNYLFLFLPYIISNLYFIYLIRTYTDKELVGLFFNNSTFTELILFNLFLVMDFLSFPVVILLGLVILAKHRKRIVNEFSYEEEIDLNWLRYFNLLLLLVWIVISIPSELTSFFFEVEYDSGFGYGLAIGVPFIYAVGYFVYKQQPIFKSNNVEEIKEITKYAKSGIGEDGRKKMADHLLQTVNSKKLYTQNKLSLDDLSEITNISKHNLSEILNIEFKATFYDFINELRIKEFESRLKQGAYKKLTLLAIAYDCGFNSKTSFNRVFKQVKGITPSEYLKKIKHK